MSARGALTFDDITANDNQGYGMTATSESHLGTVKNLTANGNSGNGAIITGVTSFTSCTFGESETTGNGGAGLEATAANVDSVTDVVARFNTGYGASFNAGQGHIIMDNSVPVGRGLVFSDNGAEGLKLTGGDITIQGVTAARNTTRGLEVTGYGKLSVSSSSFDDNLITGILSSVLSSRRPASDVTSTFTDVTANRNRVGASITHRVSGHPEKAGLVTVRRCSFDDNTATVPQAGRGLGLSGWADYLLDRVSMQRNAGQGMRLNAVNPSTDPNDAVRVVITGSHADSNGSDGLFFNPVGGGVAVCGSTANNNSGWGVNGTLEGTGTFANGLTMTGNALGANNLTAPATCPGPTRCQKCEVLAAVDGVCPWVEVQEGDPCDDNDPCTQTDVCTSSQCAGTDYTCSEPDQCHQAGSCNGDGTCSYDNKPNNTECDDQDANTVNDVCTDGNCAGVDHCIGVTCTALDECHEVGSCDHATGDCSNPAKDDETPCSIGVCRYGLCTPVPDAGMDASQPEHDAGSAIDDGGTSETDGGATIFDAGSPTNPDAGLADIDGGTTTTDAGLAVPDAGATTTDAGLAMPDAGTTNHDAGSTMPDAGTMTTDAGLAMPDAGTTKTDAGSTMSDAGTTKTDAGSTMSDAGTTTKPDATSSTPDSGTSSNPDAGTTTNRDAGLITNPDGGAPVTEAAGVDTGSTGTGGCGCSSGGNAGSRVAVILLGLLVIRMGRRRVVGA